MGNYWNKFKNIRYLAKHYVPVLTSRGCPYACSYCEAWKISGRKIRYHSVEYVIEWIRRLKKNYGVTHFAFVDDALTVDRERFKKLCEEIIRQGLDIKWDCAQNAVRFDTLDEEMLKLMERSGCFYMTVAVESGSQKILGDMKKNTDLSSAAGKIALIKKHTGMTVMGYFILGYPTETREDIKRTIRFARRLKLDAASFFLFTPHPGTEITENLVRDGRLTEANWQNFNYDEPSVEVGGISKKALKFYRNYAYFSFHIRPSILGKILFRHLNPVSGFGQLSNMIRRYLLN